MWKFVLTVGVSLRRVDKGQAPLPPEPSPYLRAKERLGG